MTDLGWIVLDRELIQKIKGESVYIGILFVISLVMFKILFYKEGFLLVLRLCLSLFWMFVVPGFSLMYYWHEKLGFIERLIVGVALSAALIGIASYYLGLAGFHIKYHTVVLPVVFLVIGGIIIWNKGETK